MLLSTVTCYVAPTINNARTRSLRHQRHDVTMTNTLAKNILYAGLHVLLCPFVASS